MVVWEMWGQNEQPIYQYFATKKEATVYARLHKLEDVTIKKIVVNNRRKLALELNYLADMLNA
jgi:hypothetical protein